MDGDQRVSRSRRGIHVLRSAAGYGDTIQVHIVGPGGGPGQRRILAGLYRRWTCREARANRIVGCTA